MTTAISWVPKPFIYDRLSPSKTDADHEVANAFGDEVEDTMIRPTDTVIVTARSENDEHGLIEVWTFEDREYEDREIHHDIQIKASPLCTGCPCGERSLLGVGTTDTSIEIWDLNDNKVTEPCVLLGGTDGHTESVLGLAWHEFRNDLASVSADNRVKIWDVVTGNCDITMEHHLDKVQAVAWNDRAAPWVVLSGSSDRTVVAKDMREPPSHSGYTWSVTAGVKSLAWNPYCGFYFVASLEDGTVKCFDARFAPPAASIFTLHGHTEAVTSVSYNPLGHNILATGSLDQTAKLWDLSNNQPTCVASKNPSVGDIFSISFSKDDRFMLAIGGKLGKLHIWDTSDSGNS